MRRRTCTLAGAGWLAAALCACASSTPTPKEPEPMAETITEQEPGEPDPTAAGEPSAANHGQIPGRLVQAGEGDKLSMGPVSLEYKLREQDGAGFSMIEYTVAGKFDGPPTPHWHTREHFVAYVLEGEIAFQLAQGERRVAAGGSLHLPPGAPFAWSNPHDAPARFLCIWSPGGFESFFEEVHDGLRERAGSGPPRPEHMAEVIGPLWKKYGLESE